MKLKIFSFCFNLFNARLRRFTSRTHQMEHQPVRAYRCCQACEYLTQAGRKLRKSTIQPSLFYAPPYSTAIILTHTKNINVGQFFMPSGHCTKTRWAWWWQKMMRFTVITLWWTDPWKISMRPTVSNAFPFSVEGRSLLTSKQSGRYFQSPFLNG